MENNNGNGDGINKVIIEERRRLRDYFRVEFPDAESITVKSCCEMEIVEVKLNGDDHAGTVAKLSKIKKKALPELPLIRVRDLHIGLGFRIEGPSPSHILAVFQE